VISKVIDSPIGYLQLVANDHALSELNWPEQHTHGLAQSSKRSKILDQAEEELRLYFEGQLYVFHVPLTPTGTAFQQQVWTRLATIEWGKTCSYKTIACGINKPTAMRAVGTAIGKNPAAYFHSLSQSRGQRWFTHGVFGGDQRKAPTPRARERSAQPRTRLGVDIRY
jgi:methylated-DNA-[protein]-cysteine S-methyltransferase